MSNYKQGECFRCGKKDIVGCVCDKCAEEDALEQAREDDYDRRQREESWEEDEVDDYSDDDYNGDELDE